MGMRSAWMVLSVLAVGCGRPPSASHDGETSTEVGETTTETTTGGFPPPPIDLPAPCDPWLQDCPAGEKCVPYSQNSGVWDANKCVPVLGDGAPGEPCTSGGVFEATDDCDATSVCWNYQDVEGELIGTCQPLCMGTPDDPTCPNEWYCQVYGNGALTVCEFLCDPVAQDCPDGHACIFSSTAFWCAVWTQGIPAGEPCGYIYDCAMGLVCLAAEVIPGCEGSACCTNFCDLNLGDGPCDALLPGSACVPLFDEGVDPIGWEHVGACMVLP
jgi:hypothetical protein